MKSEVPPGYPQGQLAAAFLTAATHEDAATRERAEGRGQRWLRVLQGMATGTLSIGSRTPVAGMPAWVTPEVLRGGFATGVPAAAVADGGAAFAHYLTDRGQAELSAMLDSGNYRLEHPEQAALLAVTWLLRAGDRTGALSLLDEIGPYATQLSFAPQPSAESSPDPAVVWRSTAGEVGGALDRRKPNQQVAAMQEALTVWNPFADELLTFWLADGLLSRAAEGSPSPAAGEGLRSRAGALVSRYEALAAMHTHCGKHRKPKENLAILLAATRSVASGEDLTPRQQGLLRHTIDAMVVRRGRPGSAEHAALRLVQSRQAAVPSHHLLARAVVTRIAALDPERGITDVAAICAPVDEVAIPASIQRVVRRATAGRIPELLAAGVIPSAEVLAGLVPQIAAEASAAAYPDPALRTLMAATYRAFSRRRSLLLLDLQHQVRLTELPWVAALSPHRGAGDQTRGEAHATLRRLGELALDGFPATLLPNPLLQELSALSREAGLDLPWVEELAADIFMGHFSPKFSRAAQLAGETLAGSLYARYYDINYPIRIGRRFDELARTRADTTVGSSVAANGMVIEQAQILTTHNLLTLAGAVGVTPVDGWPALSRRCFATMLQLAARIDHNPRPLPTIKDIAYAWRQLLIYLSLPGAGDPRPLIDQFHRDLAEASEPVRARLTPAVVGLGHVAAGGHFEKEQTPGGGRRLMGWTTKRHWMLS